MRMVFLVLLMITGWATAVSKVCQTHYWLRFRKNNREKDVPKVLRTFEEGFQNVGFDRTWYSCQ